MCILPWCSGPCGSDRQDLSLPLNSQSARAGSGQGSSSYLALPCLSWQGWCGCVRGSQPAGWQRKVPPGTMTCPGHTLVSADAESHGSPRYLERTAESQGQQAWKGINRQQTRLARENQNLHLHDENDPQGPTIIIPTSLGSTGHTPHFKDD